MRFRLIDEEKTHHTVSRLARALGVSRAGYHAWRKRPVCAHKLEDERLKELIAKYHAASRGIYGAPRIKEDLADFDGLGVSGKRVARLMRELNICGVSHRSRQKRARRQPAERPLAPDLVHRRFSAAEPNRLWFADITYIPTWEGWLFLAAVVDACTRRCCGWSMRDDLTADLVIDALGMAVTRSRPGPGLIHHSDRGSQYSSLIFGKALRTSNIMPSMGSRGDAYDNAAAESFMATFKKELVHRHRFKTKDEARMETFSYIEGFYNPYRRHSSLGQKSPLEYEKMFLQASARADASR